MELAEVEDLEIAALAALARPGESSSEEEEYSEYSEESQSDEDVDMLTKSVSPLTDGADKNDDRQPPVAEPVRVWLTVQGDDSVSCTLAADTADDASASSSSDDDDEVFDANQLRAIVDAMDEKDGDAEEAAVTARHDQAEMFPAQQLNVTLTAEDSMLPVGTIASVVGNMVVVQSRPGCAIADEGSVLCLGLEDVLGCDHLKKDQAHSLHAEDVAEEEVEFSDDEKEAEYRRGLAAQAGTSQPSHAPHRQPQGRGAGGRSRGERGRGTRRGGRSNWHPRQQPAPPAESSILGPPPQMLVHQVGMSGIPQQMPHAQMLMQGMAGPFPASALQPATRQRHCE
ncbi:hypothetical protein WJX73_008880 [Symbiochloris irregularis]|uniref:Uncharacterized protein n=1 Tax=Symbiochloris irregularis TaxID=706552 RepID=A0AAW1NWK4_9CHLO